jgi:hypothetical protein
LRARLIIPVLKQQPLLSREGVVMTLRAWTNLARLDKLKLVPRGACFSLPSGRQPGLPLRATKGDEARPALFFNRAVLFADSAEFYKCFLRLGGGILAVLLAAASSSAAFAQNAPFTFEGYADSTVLTNQYTGAIFSNAIVLTAGVTLNEFEFPPHSPSNVASDNGGPISIVFSSGVNSFSGYFTYSVPLTVQAFDSSNHLLTSATSAFSNNEALSGVSRSPNELLQVSSATSIYKVVIAGSAQGVSFVMDDVTAITPCDVNQDGYTNVNDVQAIVNQSLGTATANAALNGSGVVNVVDVQIVINAVLGRGCTVQ